MDHEVNIKVFIKVDNQVYIKRVIIVGFEVLVIYNAVQSISPAAQSRIAEC